MKILKFKYPKKARFILCLLLPIASYYLMESLTFFPFDIHIWLQMIGWVFCILIAALFINLSGNITTGLLLEYAILIFISYANDFVLMARKSPILPWDLASVGTAVAVAGEYTFEITPRVIIIGLLWIVLILLTIPARQHIESSFRHRIGGMVTCVVLFLVLMFGLQQQSIDDFLDVYEMPFTQDYAYRQNGFFVSFFVNMKYLHVDKPNGYSAEAAEEILKEAGENAAGSSSDKSADNAAGSSSSQTTDSDDLPNIIVIMNEAFSDLSVINSFDTNEDYLPYFNSLLGSENTISGSLKVSVLGGNTANTEFEFLTGNTMAFLPTGSIPYQQYITDEVPALPSLLASYGYSTTALHPYIARGWRRQTIYPLLGFNKMLFSADFTYRERMRSYVTDESAFKQVISEYEKQDDDGPFFSFLVTMQNHGGYAKEWDDFTRTIQVENSGLAHLDRINAYLTCIKATDDAFKDLISYYENVDEKTIILMFGDHQPNVETSFIEYLYGKKTEDLTDEELSLRYQTPFLLWANYDIEEQSDVNISANYLSTLLLEAAGIPSSDYADFLTEVQEKLPVLTANYAYDSDGNFYAASDYDNMSDDLEKLLNEYEIVQYYNLFGKSKRDYSLYYPE